MQIFRRMVGEFITRLFNKTSEWRGSAVASNFKDDGHNCNACRSIKLISHGTKLWERLEENRMSGEVICEPQCLFHTRQEHYRCNICFKSGFEVQL